MKNLCREFWGNEAGLILSAEMVLILTIAVLGIVVGLVQVQTAVVTEFQDLALAFSSLNQSYSTPAFFGCRKWWGRTAWTSGSGFIDIFEGCIANGGGGIGGYGGYGGYGGGMGGYSEIGGGNYGGQWSSGTATPAATTLPCETCVSEPPCETCTPGTLAPGSMPANPTLDNGTLVPVHPDHSHLPSAPASPTGAPAPPTRDGT